MRHIILLFGALALSMSLTAQPEKWTPLFNGKNLDGWSQKGGQAQYTVEKGLIVGTSAPNTPNSFLCTTAEYDDFILELELLANDGLNSGIQIRSQARAGYNEGRVFGWQVEVDPTARAWSGGI